MHIFQLVINEKVVLEIDDNRGGGCGEGDAEFVL